MKSLIISLSLLLLVLLSLICYERHVCAFSAEAKQLLHSLPDDTEGLSQERAEAKRICERLLSLWEQNKTLLRLGKLREQIDRTEEKLLRLKVNLSTEAYGEALCLKELLLQDISALQSFP